jgi:hypothetical protein
MLDKKEPKIINSPCCMYNTNAKRKKKYPPQSQFLQSSAVPISNSEKKNHSPRSSKNNPEVVKNVIP